jgi:hypothetical protein
VVNLTRVLKRALDGWVVDWSRAFTYNLGFRRRKRGVQGVLAHPPLGSKRGSSGVSVVLSAFRLFPPLE